MKNGINKSAVVRELLTAHPTKSPAEIAGLFNQQFPKNKVTPQTVSTVKSNMKGKTIKPQAAVAKATKAAATTSHEGSVADQLMAASQFIQVAGGIDKATAVLDQLRQIAR